MPFGGLENIPEAHLDLENAGGFQQEQRRKAHQKPQGQQIQHIGGIGQGRGEKHRSAVNDIFQNGEEVRQEHSKASLWKSMTEEL